MSNLLNPVTARIALGFYSTLLDGFKQGESEDEIVRKKKGIRHIIRVLTTPVQGVDRTSVWIIADADPTKGFLPNLAVSEAIHRFNDSEMKAKGFSSFAELSKDKKHIRVMNAFFFHTDAYLTPENYAEVDALLIHLSVMNQMFCESIRESISST